MRIVADRVTLDTNVYVSVFQFGGMRLLYMAVDGDTIDQAFHPNTLLRLASLCENYPLRPHIARH